MIESLEARRLLAVAVNASGVLSVTGSYQSDTISVDQSGTNVLVTINAQLPVSFDVGTLTGLSVDGLSGGDSIVATQAITLPATLNGSGGNDTILGGGGDDSLIGGSDQDSLNGGGGNDTLDGGSGADTVAGSDGIDTADYSTRVAPVSVSLDGVANDGWVGELDNVLGDVENISGGSGADHLVGNALSNSLAGNGGNDTLDGGAGADTLSGGKDIDKADYTARSNGVIVSLNGVADDGETGEGDNVLPDVENISGGSGGDQLIGDSANNSLAGNGGNDTLDGGLGADTMAGNAGIDVADYSSRGSGVTVSLDDVANDGEPAEGDNVLSTIENVRGGGGDDLLIGSSAANSLMGNGGNDTLRGGTGADTSSGGIGFDVADYQTRNHGITVSLDGVANDGEPAEGDNVLPDVEGVWGGSNSDVLIGNGGDNSLAGNGGDDTLKGGDGNDSLFGGIGRDSLDGQGDNDSLDGGSGNDSLDGELGDDTIAGGDDRDTVTYATRVASVFLTNDGVTGSGSSTENDILEPDIEVMIGGMGNDLLQSVTPGATLSGGAGSDSLQVLSGDCLLLGGGGGDSLVGGIGNDTLNATATLAGPPAGSTTAPATLLGSDGNDLLIGGNGDDIFDGLAGNDTAMGGGGNDFVEGDVGTDSLLGQAGNDTLLGESDNDTLAGGTGIDSLNGGAGADQLYLGDAPASVSPAASGESPSILSLVASPVAGEVADGGSGDNTIIGSDGPDTLVGGDGADSIAGMGGDDLLLGGLGNDTEDGGDGNDSLYGDLGSDSLQGGNDNDIFANADGEADTVDGQAGLNVAQFEPAGVDVITNVFELYDLPTSSSSSISSASLTQRVSMPPAIAAVTPVGPAVTPVLSNGILTITGATLNGAPYNNTLLLTRDSVNVYVTANGNVPIAVPAAGLKGILVTAGDGNDLVRMTATGNTSAVNIPATLSGGKGNDTLIGGSGNDSINGGGRDDLLAGSFGNDNIFGGPGNDHLYGGLIYEASAIVQYSGSDGADTLGGGADSDTADYTLRLDPLVLRMDLNKPVSGAPQEGDLISPDIERLLSGAGGDYIVGNTLANYIAGGDGNDTIFGLDGTDRLIGGRGSDLVYGGTGVNALLLRGDGSADGYNLGDPTSLFQLSIDPVDALIPDLQPIVLT